MNIYLIRHAQSKGNISKEEYYRTNDWDIELTVEGELQAAYLANTVQTEIQEKSPTEYPGYCDNLFISSSFKRAKQTREIVYEILHSRGFSIKNMQCPLLIERQWGGLREIVDNRELDREQHFQFYYRPPNGESFMDCYQRVVMFFQELRTNPKYQGWDNIFIFSHGEWIRLALMYLDGKSVEEFTENRKNPKNCEVIKRVL
jgi:broad specificity phosphatase PhoE